MRIRVVVATALVLLASTACQPNRKSVDVVNAGEQPVRVRVWDRPHPGNVKENFFKDARVPALSSATVKQVVTDDGERDWSAEITSGPGAGEVLSIKHTGNRVVVIPARVCSS